MTEEAKKTDVSAVEDEELSALLDSAVADFDKVAKPDEKTSENAKKTEKEKPTPPDTLWTEDFARNQNLSSLFSPGPDGAFNMESFGAELQRLAEASTQAAGFESPDAEFSNIISQTLRNLSESASDIQNQFSEEDLMNMLGSLSNMSDNEQDPGELFPFMQKMMQNLLSKDILHPALVSLAEKYPGWLDENRASLPADDVSRYEKQYQKVKEICSLLEQEKPEDSEELKKQRFDQVLVLLQEMQDCGQPPAELVGDMGPMLDEQGRPVLPTPAGMPDQCLLQ